MDDPSRDDLDDRLDAIEAAVADLRDELRPRRGVPRSARPRELLRFTDEYAIPAAIAALEANVRALELLRAGIRASDPEPSADDAGRGADDLASEVGRAPLERLDRALDEVESAIEDSGMPGNREARRLLTDARRLDEEVRGMLEAGGSGRRAGSDRGEAVRIEVREEGGGDQGTDADESDDVAAEVEAELETVKDEVAGEGEEDAGDDEE